MNIQNIPRADKTIKRAFVPKLDAFLFADYSKIEPCLAAYFMAQCGDPTLRDKIATGEDVYTAIAQAYYGKQKISEEERQLGKVVFLSLLYGAGRPSIMKTLGVDWDEAGKIIRRFHRAWPGIGVVQDRLLGVYERRGYIKTIAGRRLHPESEHKALNALIQGSAAEIMKRAAVRTHAWLREKKMTSHIVALIHDELMFDALRAELSALAAELPRLMDEPTISAVVPITIDIEVGLTSWADKVPYEEGV